MATRAINRNMLLTTSSAKSVADSEIISQEGSLGNTTKIAEAVLCHQTNWLPELKIEKPSNDFSSLASA